MEAEGAGYRPLIFRLRLRLPPKAPKLSYEALAKILLRLPPTDVLRARAVCKAWLRLATHRDLLLVHHLLQPVQPLLVTYGPCPSPTAEPEPVSLHYGRELEALDLRTDKRRMVLRVIGKEHDGNLVYDVLEVHATCDGLVLFSFLNAFIVSNPATRQSVTLPMLDAREIVGFYRHAATGEYRILFHRRDDGLETKYYVLTVGSQEARRIERRASSVPVSEALERGLVRACTMPPVLLHGSLHWPPQLPQDDNILVFHTAAESFRWMRPPVIRKDTFLSEMNGKLAMSCCEQNGWRADLWLMQDYENEAWVCTYRIELPVVEINRIGNGLPWTVAIVSQEGDMLVECFEVVLHYDSKGELQGTFRSDGRTLLFSRHMLRESLVPHAFLQERGSRMTVMVDRLSSRGC